MVAKSIDQMVKIGFIHKQRGSEEKSVVIYVPPQIEEWKERKKATFFLCSFAMKAVMSGERKEGRGGVMM